MLIEHGPGRREDEKISPFVWIRNFGFALALEVLLDQYLDGLSSWLSYRSERHIFVRPCLIETTFDPTADGINSPDET
jgi:hypothetical protein